MTRKVTSTEIKTKSKQTMEVKKMKRIISAMLMLLLVLSMVSAFALAEEDIESGPDQGGDLLVVAYDGEDSVVKLGEEDVVIVLSDDSEVEQVEAIDTAEQDALIDSVVAETGVSDEELMEELGIEGDEKEIVMIAIGATESDCMMYKQECDSGDGVLCEKWKTNCGEDRTVRVYTVKQLVLNKQLKQRIHVASVSGNAILKHLEKKEIDTTELEVIQDKIIAIKDGLNDEMSKEDFLAKMEEVKVLVKEFKDKVHELVPAEELDNVKETVQKEKDAKKEELDKIKEEERKIRQFYNKKEQAKAFEKINEEVREMRAEGKVLIKTEEKYKELNELRSKCDGDLIGEAAAKCRMDWQEKLGEYNRVIFDDKLTNERVELKKEMVDIKEALIEAKQAGEDTTELEIQLEEVKEQVKELAPGQIKKEEADAKIGVMKNKLDNLKEKNVAVKEKTKEIKEKRIQKNEELKEAKVELKKNMPKKGGAGQ